MHSKKLCNDNVIIPILSLKVTEQGSARLHQCFILSET